jgi:hypothetical protein
LFARRVLQYCHTPILRGGGNRSVVPLMKSTE